MLVVDGVARHLLDAPRFPSTDFDLLESSYDNAGNTIHAEAPFEFWDDGSGTVIDGRRLRARRGGPLEGTIDFANRHGATFVLSAANFFQFGGTSEARRASYERLQADLERLDVPLVVLGLGVQAPRWWNPRDHTLPQEAINLMKFLGERCVAISVRGEFTASILRDYAGVRNTIVTGCPSFFQRPEAFAELRNALQIRRRGKTAFSVTNLWRSEELDLLSRAAGCGHEWIDVRHPMPGTDEAFLDNVGAPINATWRGFVDARSWQFYLRSEYTFGYGTRLHANMALLLAGIPALWVVHDSRTVEAVNALHLPSVTIQEALDADPEELHKLAQYDNMFEFIDRLFSNFNDFLEQVDLPPIVGPKL